MRTMRLARTRILSRVLGLCAIAGLAWVLSSPSPAAAVDEVTYQMSWIPTGSFAVLSAGIEKGFYKEVGINLKMSTGRGSGDAVKKVAGGGSMFGDGDMSAVMLARVKENAPVKCLFYWQGRHPSSVFVLASSGIKTFKDLAGKTLATTPGNSNRNYFPITARLAGLDANTVKWVVVDPTTMPSLLVNKKVDGVPYFTENASFVRPQVEAIGDKLVVIPYADYGFDIYSYCTYTRDDVLKQNPDLVKRFLAATQRSYFWARDNQEEAARIHQKRWPDTKVEANLDGLRDLLGYMFGQDGKGKWTGHYDMEKVQRTYSVVAESLGLDPKVDTKQFVDDSLLPRQ
jgi:NitT/TauT family transport system substrate-binding protein